MAKTLTKLNSSEYEHPFDKKALAAVKAIPLLPSIAEFFLKWSVVRQSIISLCGSNFHITRESCPDLHNLCDSVFRTLKINVFPDVYSSQDYYINAYTTGHDTSAYIVLSSGAVDRLDDAELSFVIGHEAGHIKSGHVLYHLMSAYIGSAATLIPGIGPGMASPIIVTLRYWNRMSEFTADRAGLLACQDINAALRAIMKMSGLPQRYYDSASLEGFIQQAKEFEHKYSNTADQTYKLLEIIDEDHPWTVLRAAELIKWYESGEYDRIVNLGAGKICPVCKMVVESDAPKCHKCGNSKFQ